MVELADFVPHSPVPAGIVEEYRGQVPDGLVGIGEQYGYGTFGPHKRETIASIQVAVDIQSVIGH